MSGNPRGRGSGRGGESGGRGGGDRGSSRGGRGGDRGGRGGASGGPSSEQPKQMAMRGGPSRGRGDRGGDRGRGTGPPRGPHGGGGGRGGGRGGIYDPGEPAPAPDARVHKAEDDLVKETKGKIIDGFPGRPGYGTQGKQIVLRANYFVIATAFEQNLTEQPLYRYELSVSGEVSKPKRRQIFEEVLLHPVLKDVGWGTDYATILVTTKELDIKKHMGGSSEMKITLSRPGGQQQQQQENPPDFVQEARRRNTFLASLNYQGSFNLRQMIEYLRSPSAGAMYQGSADLIQMLNIIIAKPPNSSPTVRNIGQNKFYPFHGHPGMESANLGAGLEALRGYYSSVRPTVGRMLLNLNATSGAFFKPMRLFDLIAEFGDGKPLDQIEAFIRMLKVEAKYVKDGQNKPFMVKTKSIVGFARPTGKVKVKRFGNAREVKFGFEDRSKPGSSAQEISVFDYFKRQHGITLRSPDRPVLNVGTPGDPQYLPAELCTVLPGQAYRRLLSGDQTTEMLGFAARFPNLNAMSIAGTPQTPGTALRLLRLADPAGSGDPQTGSVKPFGISVSTKMITVPGRILAAPQIKYGNKSLNPRSGSWNSANQRFVKPGKFDGWQVVILNVRGNRGNALVPEPTQYQPDISRPAKLIDDFAKFLKDYGIQMGTRHSTQEHLLEPLTMQNREQNDKQLKQIFANADAKRAAMMLVILPANDKWLYARLKFHGDITYGIGTVCAVGSKMQKPNGQGMYFGNLALKFNTKGGGVSHSVNNVIAPVDKNTMIVGIDVTHPSPGSSEGAPSIACMVASTDSQMFAWPGSIKTQKGRQEMVDGIEQMMNERLDLWQKHNGSKLPTKIIIYRDGVSEGQYMTVLKEELPGIEKAFTTRYGAKAKHPKLAIIIVGKRHHTRFYPTREQDADYDPQRQKGNWNPLPGTVVDRGVTSKILREFYLQAHQGLQGTARPAHYVVIKDEISFEADQLEQFTHHLCYLFNRATKAVSICPPAYYADLLCERGRSYLFTALAENNTSESKAFDSSTSWSGEIHPKIKNTTWYV
ncbi:unnamed protein product [Zymoseptoria tritici ST99CH_3D1]|nr:unnamed protein product [Zymoseptoria tritici ST99CH_3D1]